MDQNIQMRSFRLAPHHHRFFPHTLPNPNSLNITNGLISAKSVSNFDSPFNSPVNQRRQRPCIMCGSSDSNIPSQNKRVCKECDTCFWLWVEHQVVFKFCKGCKNFCVLGEFSDKPDNAKCCRCRERSRDWYLSKKPSASTASVVVAVTPGPSTTTDKRSSKGSVEYDEDNQDEEEGKVAINRRRRKRTVSQTYTNNNNDDNQAFNDQADETEMEEAQLQHRYGHVKKRINFSPLITSSIETMTNNKISHAQPPRLPQDNKEVEEKENIPSPIKGRGQDSSSFDQDSSWEWDEKKNPLFLLASLSSERI